MKLCLLIVLILASPFMVCQAQTRSGLDIKCNGEDADVTVLSTEDVILTIEVDTSKNCIDVDYWVLLKNIDTNKKWSFSSYDRKWHRGWCFEYLTGPIADITDTVMDFPLPIGKYIAYLGVDSNPNGTLNIGALLGYDMVDFEVIAAAPEYAYDDGTSENAVGLTVNGQFCWIHKFDTLPGAETIANIQAAFGTPVAPGGVINGAPCTVYVWNDPDNDGDPSNAVLLHSEGFTIADPDTDTFNVYTLSSTVSVSGVFFVGCMVDTIAGTAETPAPVDTQTPYIAGNGWYAFAQSPNTFNPNDLTDNDFLSENAAGFIPWYYLLRAGYQP